MDLIAKLQEHDPAKLTELCRMHLTFTLDLADHEFAALLDSKVESKNKKNYFMRKYKEKNDADAMLLTQEIIAQIYQVIEFLGRDININHEGLFRKTGSLTRQQELKSLLSAGAKIDFNQGHYSVDDCASVMKSFLADLPEPLLTEAHYSAHCQIADMVHDSVSEDQRKHISEHQLKSLRLLILLLPKENYCLLKYVLLLLNQVNHAHEKNKMTSKNLATVFAPQLICPRKMSASDFKANSRRMVKAVAFLIENAFMVFEPPLELVRDVAIWLNEFYCNNGPLSSSNQSEAVKTSVAFCEHNVQSPQEYTKNALAELHTYIHSLPNSARKRKLIKKLQNENSENTNESVGSGRKHFRSRSVGEALKKHLWRGGNKGKDSFHKKFHHASYDMLTPSTSEQLDVKPKAKSIEALNLEKVPPSKMGPLSKNWLRASKKIKSWQS